VDGRPEIEIERPREVWEILKATVDLFRRVPVLFLVLAAIVVVPYELIVLAISGAGPFTQVELGFVASKGLLVADSFLVTPLISAFHVRAIRELGEGGRPRLADTLRQSLPRLPVVAVAAGISGVAISLGSLAFAVPGLFLMAIWPVVALERGNPIDALRRSITLTRGNRWHSFGLVFAAGLIAAVPLIPLSLAFRHTDTTALSFLSGTAVQVVVRSFEALATGLLYFDLLARPRSGEEPSMRPARAPLPTAAPTHSSQPVEPRGHPLDRYSWTDEQRPAGWYVDPALPSQMRWWPAHGGTWSTHTAKTPKGIRDEWDRYATERVREGLDRGSLDRLPPPALPKVEPDGHPLDPMSWSNEDRPAGWYVDLESPWRMRYWAADGKFAWSGRTAKTPKQTLAEWKDPRWARERSERDD
jgi:hypothetical protein